MPDQTSRASVRSLAAILLALAVAFAPAAFAEEGGGLPDANVNVHDQASLQRGARLFMNYCVGCHSLKYLRYSQMAEGLGLTEQQVMDNLNFTGAKFGEPIVSSMPEADAEKWFGKVPPDLSLEVSAKGADWVAAYLKSFYLDPSTNSGWNNTVFPNVAMPFPLWRLQGEQVAVMNPSGNGQPATVKELKLAHPGSMTPAQYDQAVRDLTTFLTWVSAPDELVRSRIGAWVVLYLVLFTLFALVLKKEYWKDVH
ncbi:MAG: Ubiquinol-cytochrome C reductase, cytochrome C1 subunit [Rhodanobacteraceae bacterium]|jgi:ubiquinol-cytochrome c reductase cytochrome c1 subunit|nr:MAG: Ubiquinol-cytochrome C reductase, cytochrome C1 subunit [Rhodanobacteraceae bacterium]